MSPRIEFIVLSSLLALALALATYMLLTRQSDVAQWASDAWQGLIFGLPAAASAALAACLVLAWQRRAQTRQRLWSALGLNGRIVLLAFLLFPLLMAAGLTAFVVSELPQASATGSLASTLQGLPSVALYFGLIAVFFGALPSLIIEYFICRRYLRRTAVTTGSA